MKPLDFVLTPRGAIGIVDELKTDSCHREECEVSIEFVGPSKGEKCAWWNASELLVIDNLAALLARKFVHPFGSGQKFAEKYYPTPKL